MRRTNWFKSLLSDTDGHSWGCFGRMCDVFWLLLRRSWAHPGFHGDSGLHFKRFWKGLGWVWLRSGVGFGQAFHLPPPCPGSAPCLPWRWCSRCCTCPDLHSFNFGLLLSSLQCGSTCEAHPPPPKGKAERARPWPLKS